MVTPAAKRDAAAHLQTEHEVSQRRACKVLQIDRSSVRYRSRRPDDNEARMRIRALALERRRFGYRRLHLLLTKQGLAMNQKRFRRIYREEGLVVRKRAGRKRAVGTRAPLSVPSKPNERWSIDFVSDRFTDGRPFRILSLIDDFSRECLALIADTSMPGLRVARELDSVLQNRTKPKTIVSDNGTEFTSTAILKWSADNKVDWHYIARPCGARLRHDASRSRTPLLRALMGGCATNV